MLRIPQWLIRIGDYFFDGPKLTCGLVKGIYPAISDAVDPAMQPHLSCGQACGDTGMSPEMLELQKDIFFGQSAEQAIA
jgi:hypothetical protein